MPILSTHSAPRSIFIYMYGHNAYICARVRTRVCEFVVCVWCVCECDFVNCSVYVCVCVPYNNNNNVTANVYEYRMCAAVKFLIYTGATLIGIVRTVREYILS